MADVPAVKRPRSSFRGQSKNELKWLSSVKKEKQLNLK